ncbi:uncharacterized protein M437DRAFT_88242 [Aureobasidium melanogenum CBS 110374]|uniref:Uncharacterized protein n=1 Tax=Aureobasidium melanogenum (strain CBS 110374) TaxID=1043003 RepID=A0A074VE99_AURM1|nr:uncharacterized protein M437DRAFT_88242 [Aureobasidium melanogenum CBS 110374]KEQ58703.1 hypothetical protein M437DRAFT_88242 [Aureobasidium melanogenum CBS 110374]
MPFYDTIKMPKDLYATLSNGTKLTLPEEQRTQLFAKLEDKLQDRVAAEFRPLRLLGDFKQPISARYQSNIPTLDELRSRSIGMAICELEAIYLHQDDSFL